jgi:serine/threonine protein phosphatase PrpC
MGCGPAKSRSNGAETSSVRRRLSVEIVEDGDDKTVGAGQGPETEQDRSLLLSLTEQQLLSMLEEGGLNGRKFSITSDTDKALHRSSSFSSKTTSVKGDDVGQECIGYACKKGLKPEAPNQDSFFICKVEGQYSVYGVFDGHGRKGHDVSNFVKDVLPKVLLGEKDILNDPAAGLLKAFDTTQRLIEQATKMDKLDANRSGSTASVILHDHKKKTIYTAHVGDSRCVLATKVGNGNSDATQWRSVDLTEDHKPHLPAEKARIEKHGGMVKFDGGYNYRVYAKGKRYPGLNMSRAMGDLLGFHDAGISAVPDVAERQIVERNALDEEPTSPPPPEQNAAVVSSSEQTRGGNGDGNTTTNGQRPSDVNGSPPDKDNSASCSTPAVGYHTIDPVSDKFILLASDGIWEFMSSEEAVQLVSQFDPSEAMGAAERLASAAWDRWMQAMKGEVVDDITVIVMFLDPQRQR